MDVLPMFNPLDSWLPYQIAFFVGLVVCVKTYMSGPDCPSNADIRGKRVVITGGNTGIGKETALDLARRGGHIIIACRNLTKGEEALKYIKDKYPDANVEVQKLDLASFKSVRQFAGNFEKKYDSLDILINNAGVMLCPFAKTEDGHEQHFQINYLAHCLLTNLLLDKLKAAPSARIINVSALLHRIAAIHLDDLNLEKDYKSREAYGQSKLAQLLFTHHLSSQLQGTNVTVNALHPGVIRDTELLRYSSFLNNPIYKFLAFPLTWLFLKTPRSGAQTTIYLAVSPDLEKVTGKYFSDCQIATPSKDAVDDDMAKRLWDIGETLVEKKSA